MFDYYFDTHTWQLGVAYNRGNVSMLSSVALFLGPFTLEFLWL